jgi:uncharacterized protein with HEPN domain
MRDADRIRVAHMVDAIESAMKFADGRSRSDIEHDEMLLFAIVRAIEILSEAAGKVTEEARSQAPAVPWGVIIGMRNRLVHAYFDIDPNIVWSTVTQALPALLPSLRELLESKE